MRVRVLLLTGVACLMPAGLVAEDQPAEKADKAKKEAAPVVFGTDPGEAHPRNIEKELSGTVGQATLTDQGAFDYGGAPGSLDAVAIAAASSSPTPLTPIAVATLAADQQAQPGPTAAGLYQQDPIYRMAQAETAASQEIAYRPEPETTQVPEGFAEVQPGDTVFALSRRYGVRPAAIIEANGMTPPYSLDIGQVVRIPQAGEAGTGAERTLPEEPQQQAAAPAPEMTAPAMANAADEAIARTQTAEATQQPVIRQDVAYADQTMGATYHTVEQGNTLYSIAKYYGLEVQTVAQANNITPPYALDIGQQLVIPSTTTQSAQSLSPDADTPAQPHQAVAKVDTIEPESPAIPASVTPVPEPKQENGFGSLPVSSEKSRFDWPLQGQVIMQYGMSDDGRRNDGINIAAPVGTPIRAVDDGEIVYRGSELEGYGNLLLIKHSDGWVSAYAHTDAILVKKGDKIRKGQIIAKVGTSGSVDQPQLHFELRHELKPTDPIAALNGSNQLAAKQ